jgi:hypothetical protein
VNWAEAFRRAASLRTAREYEKPSFRFLS